MRPLTHLDRLEAESIHILRETVAEADAAGDALFDRQGFSAVMLHLAQEGVLPGAAAVPAAARRYDVEVPRHVCAARQGRGRPGDQADRLHATPRPSAQGINPFDHGPLHTDMWKTEGLKQALDEHGFDAAFGGARRDEEKSRAKERIFSFRDRNHRWDPKRQRPELWSLYNVRKSQGREHPRLPAVQLDRARRVAIHPARGDRDRAALFRGRAADGGARRPDPDGRRRALAARAARSR